MSSAFTKDARLAWFAIGGAVLVLAGFIVWHRISQRQDIGMEITDTPASNEEKPYLEFAYPRRTPLAVDPGPSSFVEKNEVHVKDQVAGAKVFLSQVALTQPGWVAIRDVANGAYGNILGAARFDTGLWQGEVLLLRPTVASNSYAAVLYADDGDGVFNYQKDSIILSEDAPVGIVFSVY